ncbi:MAG TPA: RNA polymerase sigma factor [Solirubrobacteraceae bacterium]|jgi:RNA polymerase sigma factor (sigma-70 family)|nr:RNA polymerase sigma factor [Solirubrobacteraceae bacterium]
MSPRISIRLLAAQSDQRLAALAGEGHERAFEALVHRYRRPLLRYCRRLRLSDARAEDVLQQAFLQAWLAFARGAEVRDVRAWLYRIVHNAAINAMRAGADGHSELTEGMQAKAALAGESELQRKMALREALTDVAALPQMQQQAIFLTAVDGQSHDEVAGVLGISEGALRGLLYRARASLRSAAAALTPPPLLEWAARGADTAGPTAERLAELSGGGGAAGMAGLLLKGAVVAVTAGAVATGATVVNSHRHGATPLAHRRSAAGPVGTAAATRIIRGDSALALTSSPSRGLGERFGPVRHHSRGRRHDGSGANTSGRHDDRLSFSVDRTASGRSDGSGGASDRGGRGRDGSGSGSSVGGSGGKGSGSSDGSSGADGRGPSSGGGGDGGGKSAGGGDGGKGSGKGSSGSSSGGSGQSGPAPAETVPVEPTSPKDLVASAPSQTPPPTTGGDRSHGDETTVASERSRRGSDG